MELIQFGWIGDGVPPLPPPPSASAPLLVNLHLRRHNRRPLLKTQHEAIAFCVVRIKDLFDHFCNLDIYIMCRPCGGGGLGQPRS